MILLKGGTIIDGTGKPAFKGDVLVDGDKIKDVCPSTVHLHLDSTPDDEVVDASGAIVSPGFIDAHTHSDAYLVIEPDAPADGT